MYILTVHLEYPWPILCGDRQMKMLKYGVRDPSGAGAGPSKFRMM